MSDRIVIVGGGVAAARVSRSYREAGGDGRVTMLSAEARLPYNRPPLSKGLLRGTIEPDAVLVDPATAYAELEIDIRLEAPVAAVDPSAGTVVLADGEELGYDRLVLATGSTPRRLGIPGEAPRRRLLLPNPRRRARRPRGGPHGRQGARRRRGLHRDGDRCLVAEPRPRRDGDRARRPALRSARPSRAVEPRSSSCIATGASSSCSATSSPSSTASGSLTHATTREGRRIEAGLAIVGIGVDPATQYLADAGIALDRWCRPGRRAPPDGRRPNVFAVGDIASFHDPVAGRRRLIQHWTNAHYQGDCAGRTLAGEVAPFDQVAYFFTEVFGVKLGLLGDIGAGHDRIVTRGNLEEGLSPTTSRRPPRGGVDLGPDTRDAGRADAPPARSRPASGAGPPRRGVGTAWSSPSKPPEASAARRRAARPP